MCQVRLDSLHMTAFRPPFSREEFLPQNCVRACVCVRMGGKHCWSIIVTSNASAEHMAPQKKGEGGPQITGDWKRAIQAVLTDSLLQQPRTDSTRLGCLKGPGAQEATLQTCCSTDRVPAHRSYDTVVTINPCLSLPSSWSRGFHVVPDVNNKKSVCGNKMPTFAHQSFEPWIFSCSCKCLACRISYPAVLK